MRISSDWDSIKSNHNAFVNSYYNGLYSKVQIYSILYNRWDLENELIDFAQNKYVKFTIRVYQTKVYF